MILIWLAGVALLAHVVLWLDAPLLWQAAAALLLTGFLPGLLTVELLLGHLPQSSRAERLLYAVGCGFAWIVLGLLALNFLPGALLPVQIILFYDVTLMILGGILWWRQTVRRDAALSSTPGHSDAPRAGLPGGGWLWAGLVTLALVGGLLRFPHLDYSEFQGDEARPLLLAAAALRGDAQAIYSHPKGPAEILIPTAIYGATQRISEAAARLPFALASFTGLFVVFWLGWRMFHPVAGWAAAMLLAVDGYLIGFARIVQYQSIVFLMMVLCLLACYRVSQPPRPAGQTASRYLLLAAIFLATGLLAHYEAALVVAPGLYLLLASRFWLRQPTTALEYSRSHFHPSSLIPHPLSLLRALIAPILLGAVLLGLFYVPFVLNPNFAATYAYIAESRIGGAFPYNNLADFFRRTTLYSPSYYIGLLALCTLIGLSAVYRRTLRGLWAWVAIGILWLGLAFAIVAQSQSMAWIPAGRDPTWLLFAAAFGVAWFTPRLAHAERALWLWLGSAMILMLFFVRTPNTHVYGFIIPWALVAGMALSRGLDALTTRLGAGRARALAIPAAALVLAIFGNYAYWYFAASPQEILHTWRENRPAGYWVPYDMPDRARFSSFGFPMRNGWKAIGALYDPAYADCVGEEDCLALRAPFTTNDRQAVADWYTRGAAYCPRDHRYYIVSHPVEPGEREQVESLRAELAATGYARLGVVQVHGRDKIEIYDRDPGSRISDAAHVLDVENYIEHFDRTRAAPWFELNGPVAVPLPGIQPLEYRFGDHIWLMGYRLERIGYAASQGPEDALVLTLYWRTDAPLTQAYTVFNQVLRMDDFHKIGQQDGEPGCDLFPTDRWQPGAMIADRYYIPLDDGAPPGVYTLLSGMYARETGDRLPIFTPAGDFIGDALGLDEIVIDP
jgi:hypothetical protein